MNRVRNRMLVLAALGTIAGVGAWAQAKKVGEEMDGQIRRAGFEFYSGMVFGDADMYLKATRMPLYVVRDGIGTTRDEKVTRALLTRLGERFTAGKVSDDERKEMVKNMIALFDEASIQYVGSNTAQLTFLVKRGATAKEGDLLATLSLYRKDGQWKVISETTDSTPVPPEYVKP